MPSSQAATLTIGDTVCLKGGGPTMTVASITESATHGSLVNAYWFDADDHFQSGQFPIGTLTPAPINLSRKRRNAP